MLFEKENMKEEVICTERIRMLKEKLRTTMPSICTDRAKLVTEAYGKFFNETPVLLKAKVTDYVLENMKIRIDDDELIVGNHGSRYRSAPIFPEYGASWIIDEIDTFKTRGTDPLEISADDEKELLSILESWKGKGFAELATSKLPDETLEAEKAGVMTVGCRITSTGHVVPNYEKLLRIGFNGVIDEAIREKAKITEYNDANQRKIDFLDAVIISAESVIKFAERYSVLAEEMADKETGSRREELLRIADVCRRVPGNPPESFQEALQFFWFVHLTIQIETNGHSIGLGRFDQHMYPFYKKDIEDGLVSGRKPLNSFSTHGSSLPSF